MGVDGQRHAPAALPPGKRPDTQCTGVRVGPGPVWTSTEFVAPAGIRSSDRLARSAALYRPTAVLVETRLHLVDVA